MEVAILHCIGTYIHIKINHCTMEWIIAPSWKYLLTLITFNWSKTRILVLIIDAN